LATWHQADGYCFLSNRLRDEYGGQFDRRKPCVVIPNPIPAKWLLQDVLSSNERMRGPVFFGRWSHEKGKDELLSVMRTFGGTRPQRCHIYSDNGGNVEEENCVFHGWLDTSEVRQVLRESIVLLLPSHAEAFPTVLLEAAACGTPFVASNIGGIPDIAEQGKGGLLHEVGDVEGMRAAIVRLLTDELLWGECSHNGRRWVESLNVSKIIPMWHRFYADLGVRIIECTK
jgi:glycosyltransferase involved in cell wall biosynthesis